uniref:BMERB domain-containing protein n=1 Tax=Gopherus agassizii TaxID=38772 RepID=A0A452IZR3_9SAUR
MQQPAAQPHTVLEENVGRPISSYVAGRAQPQEPGAGLGYRANGWSQQEEQSLRERGHLGTALRQPSPEPRPPEKGPTVPDFRQAEEEGEDTRKRKKIQLSPLEKLKLSTLSLDSETEKACPLLTLPLVLCFQRLLSLGEKEKYPTWKRTLTRRAKEEEMKRFCKAQSIQRRLEEIEVTFQKLEEKGIQLERSLRGTQSELKTQWMNKLLSLVQKKNSLELTPCSVLAETLKMPQDRLAEKEILAQLVEVVNQRNALIHVLEEKRLSELSEALPGTAQGWAG